MLNDIYFEREYIRVFEELGEGEYREFVFTHGSKKAIYPFLINSVNKLGYDLDKEYFDIQGSYGYNGISTNSYDLDFIELFYNKFNDYCIENNIIAEFTRFNPVLANHRFSMNHMDIIYDRETVMLDLCKEYTKIWEAEYSSKNRNMIRKARNAGYTSIILENPTQADICQFIDLYKYSMYKVGADSYYFFDNNFFHNMFSHLQKNVVLINVYNINNEIMCSSIFLHYNKLFHYHFSGKSVNADNSANNFLLDEAIKYAIKIGKQVFHFGGGHSSSLEDSLLKFKTNFSKSHLPFYIGKKVHNKDVYAQVISQWELKNVIDKEKYKNRLLKYRY